MAEIIEKVKSMMVLEDQCEVKAEYIKFSVESYLHQVELSRIKDMTSTPEKRLVDALREVFNCPTNESKQDAIIGMIEDYCDLDSADYR